MKLSIVTRAWPFSLYNILFTVTWQTFGDNLCLQCSELWFGEEEVGGGSFEENEYEVQGRRTCTGCLQKTSYICYGNAEYKILRWTWETLKEDRKRYYKNKNCTEFW